jgi:hypothetical protein
MHLRESVPMSDAQGLSPFEGSCKRITYKQTSHLEVPEWLAD